MYKAKTKMKQSKFLKGNKGITLIALVITIIVLLILAAVSIATLTGDNGILTQADRARTETNRESVRERVEIEALGSYEAASFDMDKFKDNLNKHLEVNPDTVVDVNDEMVVFPFEGYIVKVTEEDNGKIKVEIEENTEETDKIKEANYMIKKENKSEYYKTLLEAYNGAEAGETIVVLKDVEETETFVSTHSENDAILDIEKDITIDTNNKTLTTNDKIVVSSGTLQIKGEGTIYCNKDATAINSFGGNVETSGSPTIRSYGVGIVMRQGNGTLNLNGGYVVGGRSAIQSQAGGEILINNTVVLGLARTKNAITLQAGATCNVTITGNSVISNGINDVPGTGDSEETGLVSAITTNAMGSLTIEGNAIITTRYGSAPISLGGVCDLKILENASVFYCNFSTFHKLISTRGSGSVELNTSGILGTWDPGAISFSGSNYNVSIIKCNLANCYDSCDDLLWVSGEALEPTLSDRREVTFYYVDSTTYKLIPMVLQNCYYEEYKNTKQ